LEGDIKGCFDNIDFQWILDHIPVERRVLESWLNAGFIEQQTLFPTSAGVPQGGIISPTIANMVLDGMQRLLREQFPVDRNKKSKHQVHLVRYADDFIVTADTREVLEHEVKPLLENFLRERGLELSAEKTKVTHIHEGFDFLGQNIRKYGPQGKLLTKPSRSSQRQFREKIKKLLGEMKTAPQEVVIRRLNPVIRGWANYHRGVVSKRVFSTMDHWIWERLWRWCRRRHPRQKNRHWIADRYFVREGTRGWIFQASRCVVKGKIVKRPWDNDRPYPTLVLMSDTKIKRHIKIKQDANPYDPAWEMYFEERLTRKLKQDLRGTPRTLWGRQQGLCPECNERLDLQRSWEVHHVVYRCRGGSDKHDNLVLLHPNCHRQLHSRDAAGRSPSGENLTRA
jgi:RNA-directed DNA polymerase